ncbi:MAG: ABC transporter substrate-binding protein [Spirochaetota bacterium]
MKTKPFSRLLPAIIVIVLILGLGAFLYSRFLARPLVIGAIIPIDTSLGNEENLFIRGYRDSHRSIGRMPASFLVENPPATAEGIAEAYRRLDGLGASVILGGVLSKDGVWLAGESARTGIPTFGITSSSAVLSGKKDAFFRLCPTNASQAAAVAKYYLQSGFKRLAAVTSVDNQVYVDPFMERLRGGYRGELTQIPFDSSDSVSKAIGRYRPDAIFAILPAKDLIQVINAVRKSDPAIMIGSSSWGSVEILSLYSGPILDGVLFFSYGSDLFGDEYKAEIAAFESKYSMTATNGSHYFDSEIGIAHV